MTHLELLHQQFPEVSFTTNEPLKKYTTVGIGGPAELFCRINATELLTEVCSFAHEHKIPVTLLGWGANTLIADRGIAGLVIKNESKNIKIHTEKSEMPMHKQPEVTARWATQKDVGSFKYDFSDLELTELAEERVLVTMDSGVSLPMAINVLIAQGITGLQWYSRIPATIGGAIYNNIHGGTHFISEVLHSVTILTADNQIQTLPVDQLALGYDTSRFHTTSEIILTATFALYKGDSEAARAIASEWAARKKIQPQNSLGCVFQNISAEEQKRLGFHTPSIGYIIEHVLKLQGYTVGGAHISDQHAAFIENTGTATATDYLAVIKKIKDAARTELQLELTPEIFFMGFTPAELNGIV